MQLEKGISISTAGRPKDNDHVDVKLFMEAEHGDSFFLPFKDNENGKLSYTQTYYLNKFKQVQNRIGKSTYKMKSRKVEGGIRFWFFDTNNPC